MSEPITAESINTGEPLDKEEIVLAQAEIKALLSPYFKSTPLEGLFDEQPPIGQINESSYRSLRRDFIGTRIISDTDGIRGYQERELQVIRKLRDIGRNETDIGEMIRLVEPGVASSRQPVIEHLIVEAKGQGGGYRATGVPNSRSVVDSALALARSIVVPKSS